MALTSCNFIQNLAIENIPESTITTIEDTTTTLDTQDTNTTTQIPKERVNNNYMEITIPSYNESYVTTTTPDYPMDISAYTTSDITTTPITQATPNTSIDISYFEKYCAFIGDSLSVGLSAYGFIPENHTFAKEGISLRGINSLQLQTDNGYLYPAQAVASWKLKEVYILLGINGVSWIDNNEAISEYATLINNIKQYNPSIQINVISVLPVAYSTETIDTVANGRILNSEIDTFNAMLKNMSTQLGCHYIDANSGMKNQNGCLPDSITFDGLHLTKSGYERLIDILLQDVQLRN